MTTSNLSVEWTRSAAGGAFGSSMLRVICSWDSTCSPSCSQLHRVAAMASGGMDTLPHNGAVITLLAITGLTHRQSYLDILAITVFKTLTVFVLAFAVSALH